MEAAATQGPKVYQPVHSLLSAASQELEPCGADRGVRKHCRHAALQHLIQPALARTQAAAAAACTALATARGEYVAAAAACDMTLDEAELEALAWKDPPVSKSPAATSFGTRQSRAFLSLTLGLSHSILNFTAHTLEFHHDKGQLLGAVMNAAQQFMTAQEAATRAAFAHQQAHGSAAQVTAAATDLLRAHGRRRESAAELCKTAAALGIAAEAAVADADAAATVKQCLEMHCIDDAAISLHQQACEECRQLYGQLQQLCSKLGLPAPPGSPPAAAVVPAPAE